MAMYFVVAVLIDFKMFAIKQSIVLKLVSELRYQKLHGVEKFSMISGVGSARWRNLVYILLPIVQKVQQGVSFSRKPNSKC